VVAWTVCSLILRGGWHAGVDLCSRKVTGTVAASEYARAGETLERAIVYIFAEPGKEQVADTSSKERRSVLLIDQDGNVVRRFHHAGVADLQTEVERLLSKKK
jgi:hypothetical protein